MPRPAGPRRFALLWAACGLADCFDLGNGARVENIHWMADPSGKGQQQSFGMMVNYLYDLKKLDRHRKMLGKGKIPVSGGVADLSL